MNRFRPGRDDQSRLGADGESDASAAARDRVEQSNGASSIVSRPVAGLKLEGTSLVIELVHTLMTGAAAAAAFAMLTRRVARVQCTQSCGDAALEKTASLPSGVVE